MIHARDGQPLISQGAVWLLVSALIAPTFGGLFWLSAKLSEISVELSNQRTIMQQLQNTAYPRSEAMQVVQRLDQQTGNLMSGLVEIKSRLNYIENQRAYSTTKRQMEAQSGQAEARAFRPQ